MSTSRIRIEFACLNDFAISTSRSNRRRTPGSWTARGRRTLMATSESSPSYRAKHDSERAAAYLLLEPIASGQ
jgi:hypothetical protein